MNQLDFHSRWNKNYSQLSSFGADETSQLDSDKIFIVDI